MRFLHWCTPAFLAFVACGPEGECTNPNDYRILGLEKGEVFDVRDARIRCFEWSPGCSDQTGAVGSWTPDTEVDANCTCNTYRLEAGPLGNPTFGQNFEPAELGQTITFPSGGRMTITKRVKVPTDCAQGNYYIDYSGTLEGKVGGHELSRGVFYAIEVK
jgi:hypothetical protein